MLRSGADTAERRDWVDELAAILWRAEPGDGERPAAAACAPSPAPGPRSVAAEAVTRAHEVRPPRRDEAVFPRAPARRRAPRAVLAVSAFVAALGLGWIGGLTVHDRLTPARPQIAETLAIHSVVDRIIRAESSGDPNARNRRSTAAGGGQFLDGTWLDMIRAHRPDLARLGAKEALELRFDAALTREMTTRFAERNAAMLTARGLPVTPATLYLSHFAGGGGAVALLTAPGHVDAAAVMASADATGQTTREKIVKANPFLDGFTVAELKSWGERKMVERPSLRETESPQRSASR
jgi:hypothetical protein